MIVLEAKFCIFFFMLNVQQDLYITRAMTVLNLRRFLIKFHIYVVHDLKNSTAVSICHQFSN
jgi:hypothetical protein